MRGWKPVTFNDLAYFEHCVDSATPDELKRVVIDTETTGLDIKYDKPFMIGIGWKPHVFVFDDFKGLNPILEKLYAKAGAVWGHNIKFDMHMSRNGGLPVPTNVKDTQILARLAVDSKTPQEGGDKIGLKEISSKILRITANDAEQEVKKYKTIIKSNRNRSLVAILKQFGEPPKEFKAKDEKSWTMSTVEKLHKDIVLEVEDLPYEIQNVYKLWRAQFAELEPTYKDIYEYDEASKYAMIAYQAKDILLTYEIIDKLTEVCKVRNNLKTAKMEFDLIIPLYEMESHGFQIDIPYMEESKARLVKEIEWARAKLNKFAGEPITANQHEKLKYLVYKTWGIQLSSANKESFDAAVSKPDVPQTFINFVNVINYLRRLEKWVKVYIERWLEQAKKNNGRLYTTLNQSGAITGRFTSDFQQFPRDGITNLKGEELFVPRKMIIVSKDYDYIVAKDYDQVESKIQAHYTLLVTDNQGDVNLVRTCVPFKCHSKELGSYDVEKHRDIFQNYEWFRDEDNTKWSPEDMHTRTAITAWPHLDPKDPGFKAERNKVKAIYFAKQYGMTKNGAYKKFTAALGIDTVGRVFDALNEAFPDVDKYQKWVIQNTRFKGFARNAQGRGYFLRDSHLAYKVCNYVIQGSGADILKEVIIKLHDFLKPYKSRMIMNIHDEIIFEYVKDELHLIPDVLKIMQDVPWCKVPITAGCDITTTSWYAKEEVKDVSKWIKETLSKR